MKGISTVVKLEWGLKRTCQGCGVRFYDLQRQPIICPKCNTVFEVQSLTRSRRTRSAVVEDKLPNTTIDEIPIDTLDLPEDLDSPIEAEDDLLEDADDLAEDLDEVTTVIDHVDEGEDH